MILFLSSDYPGLVSISSRRSVLGVAVLAVYRAALGWLEWNFAFLLAVRADGFVHLSGASVEAAPVSIAQFFHSFVSVMPRASRGFSGIPARTPTPELINGFKAGSGPRSLTQQSVDVDDQYSLLATAETWNLLVCPWLQDRWRRVPAAQRRSSTAGREKNWSPEPLKQPYQIEDAS